MRLPWVFSLLGLLAGTLSSSALGQQPDQEPASAVGPAITSIFSPARAPQRKTMGLLQRSFLDIAAEGDRELEVAIVVDGTDSMKAELAGVRKSIHQMLEDLRRYRNNEVRAAIVVYRDSGSPSGATEILQKQFTSDQSALQEAVKRLQPESGAPFFHELPDLGLHKAIHELPWTSDDQVAKWILMFGDAPPYAETRQQADSKKGFRRYSTDVLIGAARAKGIRVNCVLCTSGDRSSQAYHQAVEETRNFMSRLCAGTDGLMLDLSYPQIRTALIDASKQPEVPYAEINPITAIDLASVRRDEFSETSTDPKAAAPVRVAVLPHMPLNQIRSVGSDPSHQAVQVSTALRTRLARLAGVRVASPVDIQRQLRRLRSGGSSPRQTLRGLAGRLGVDYVVWGQAAPGGAHYQTAAYRRDNGLQVVQVNLPTTADQGTWAHIFLAAASDQAGENEALGQLLNRINAQAKDSLTAPMSDNATTSAELLEALEALDQALQYDTRDPQSAKLLETANRASLSAAAAERRNPLAHWLQSNVAYNQAAHLFRSGQQEAAEKRMTEMKASLQRAINLREAIKNPSLLTEIEADYQLLVRKDIPAAIKKYEQLTDPQQPPQSQLRGHWMLSGIYAGDWGSAGQAVVDPEKARLHVMQIMANWPESPQATLLKRWLKYDESTQQTEFNYLPTVNLGLIGV
ncbi:MAG: VWA domain-containing protein [Pirellulales bacterium]|nr:VWA domain-containing protein [Pirellulales bacterium]